MKWTFPGGARTVLFTSFVTVSAVLLTVQSVWQHDNTNETLSAYRQQYLADQSQKLAFLALDRLQAEPPDEAQREWLDRAASRFSAAIRYRSPDAKRAIGAAGESEVLTGGAVWYDSGQLQAAEPYTVALPVISGGTQLGWLEMTYDLRSGDDAPDLTEARRAIETHWRRSLAVTLLVSAAFHLALAARLAKPLAAQAACAERILAGDRKLAFPGKGWAESGKLAAAVNALLAECRNQERWRQRMMQDMMHELRTPLTSILTRMEAMQDGVYPLTAHNVAKVIAELDRLSRFVDDMNRLSEAEAAKFQLRLERTELMDLLRGVWEGFQFMARDKNIELVLAPSYTPCAAEIDPDRVVQIVSNLLSNALKYTPEGGRVELGVRREPGVAVIYCRDNGEGIAAEELQNIFQRFYRARQPASRPNRGLGVGLSIVRALADAHGGAVAAVSEPGRGSVFTVTLPAIG